MPGLTQYPFWFGRNADAVNQFMCLAKFFGGFNGLQKPVQTAQLLFRNCFRFKQHHYVTVGAYHTQGLVARHTFSARAAAILSALSGTGIIILVAGCQHQHDDKGQGYFIEGFHNCALVSLRRNSKLKLFYKQISIPPAEKPQKLT